MNHLTWEKDGDGGVGGERESGNDFSCGFFDNNFERASLLSRKTLYRRCCILVLTARAGTANVIRGAV